jgi:Na+-translocating ferredoxin:NAD+ oxidoreductase RnfG subunit
MIGVSKQIVRIAILVMLFQFVCPAFLPIVTQRDAVSKETTISEQHTSIVVPLLLKEKDEKENAEFTSESDATPLLDLLTHSINLTAAHDHKHAAVYEEHGTTRPPLFRMLCTLVI